MVSARKILKNSANLPENHWIKALRNWRFPFVLSRFKEIFGPFMVAGIPACVMKIDVIKAGIEKT
jgi:hypothetical protein